MAFPFSENKAKYAHKSIANTYKKERNLLKLYFFAQ